MKTVPIFLYFLLPLYLIPLGKLVLLPLKKLTQTHNKEKKFSSLGIRLGQWEYFVGPLRDFILSPLSFLAYLILVFMGETTGLAMTIFLLFFVSLGLLSVLNHRQRKSLLLKLAKHAKDHSQIHPEDFFNYYYQSLSPWPPCFSLSELRKVSFHELNFHNNEKIRWTYLPLLKTMLSTSTLARMAMTAFHKMTPEDGRDSFDGLARLWGSRIAQIFQSRLTIHGAENIPPLEGKTLLLFNHQSYLDFALNFFALASLKKTSGRHLRPRFIAAKDHFIDNPLLYSWIGVGKAIENAGMIFINRQKKGQGWAAMEEAAEKLSHLDVEIAIYPQGTRAHPMLTASGERGDAGYYTTFHKKNWADPLGHLKPGTAHLILDSLIKLRQKGEEQLNILSVGISGAAVAAPRNSLKIQTQSEIKFHIAPVWTLATSFAAGIASPRGQEPKNTEERLYNERLHELQKQINQHLLQALSWHDKLKTKARFELTRLAFLPAEIEVFIQALEKADLEENPFPFILLDRIFSLKPALWERFLRLFLPLLDKEAQKSTRMALLEEVSERLKDGPTSSKSK